MNLAQAQEERRARGEHAVLLEISSFVDVVADRVELASIPNYQLVGPRSRAKLSGLINYYRKKPRPFTACVSDNRKRFGADAEKVCAVLTDLEKGTTKWRKGGKKTSLGLSNELAMDVFEVDDELATLLGHIADVGYQDLLPQEEC